MGVSPHVWGEVLPWLNIFATLAIYILVWVAYKFFKFNVAPDVQDEVSSRRKRNFSISQYLSLQVEEKKELRKKRYDHGETAFTRQGSTRSRTMAKSSFAFSAADGQKPGELIRQGKWYF